MAESETLRTITGSSFEGTVEEPARFVTVKCHNRADPSAPATVRDSRLREISRYAGTLPRYLQYRRRTSAPLVGLAQTGGTQTSGMSRSVSRIMTMGSSPRLLVLAISL